LVLVVVQSIAQVVGQLVAGEQVRQLVTG